MPLFWNSLLIINIYTKLCALINIFHEKRKFCTLFLSTYLLLVPPQIFTYIFDLSKFKVNRFSSSIEHINSLNCPRVICCHCYIIWVIGFFKSFLSYSLKNIPTNYFLHLRPSTWHHLLSVSSMLFSISFCEDFLVFIYTFV